ncbi:hypothetical protein [Methanoculleus sp. 10]|uniref:hypothetical protein n=1 Tax=Methanoculleus sp. 10 TaxID=430615 RepID=UPI0025F1DADE|nr:hypothetical protein [Methanoculleus sp. 10]
MTAPMATKTTARESAETISPASPRQRGGSSPGTRGRGRARRRSRGGEPVCGKHDRQVEEVREDDGDAGKKPGGVYGEGDDDRCQKQEEPVLSLAGGRFPALMLLAPAAGKG